MEEKCYHTLQRMVFRNFLGDDFFTVGPPPAGSGDLVFGTERNPGPGQKTRKRNFPVLGALLGGDSGRPKKFSPKFRAFCTVYVSADQTPAGGKSQNTGF